MLFQLDRVIIVVEDIYIVGMKYYGQKELLLESGYQLKRDHHNRYHDHAVSVKTFDKICKTKAHIIRHQGRVICNLFELASPIMLKVKSEGRKSRKGVMQKCRIAFHCPLKSVNVAEEILKKAKLDYKKKDPAVPCAK